MWDEELMGEPEPKWSNHFSWDIQAGAAADSCEIVVPLSVEYRIKPKLNFQTIHRKI